LSTPRILPKSLYIESRRYIINKNCGEAVRALKHASPPSLSVELGTVGLWNGLSRDKSKPQQDASNVKITQDELAEDSVLDFVKSPRDTGYHSELRVLYNFNHSSKSFLVYY
jgi:hypothetical protein